jgi:phosphatidate cytidylyltransferase
MKNFYFRLLTSFLMIPIFLFILYEGKTLFYFSVIIILLASTYEIFKNVKQFYLSFFLYILIICFAYSIIKVRGNSYSDFIHTTWVVLIVWLSDIGGYVFGKIFGGAKLTKLSPNKTISGFIGSVIFSQFSIIIFYFLSFFVLNFSYFVLQFLFCIISVMGDIFFSYVKRINKIKDYSNLLPGHGGMLDRIDGMIFAIIFFNISSII